VIHGEGRVLGVEAARRLAELRRVEIEPGLTRWNSTVSSNGSGSSSPTITGRSWPPGQAGDHRSTILDSRLEGS
jgi:hypothetical protein